MFVGNGTGTSGTVNVNGGTMTFGALSVGNSYSGSTVDGDNTGTVSINGKRADHLGPGSSGQHGVGVGTLNLSNGDWLILSSASANIALATGSTETGDSGTIKFNGDGIQYNAPPTPAIAANITTVIQDGGATLNTNGSASTIASSLVHGGTAAIDGGLTKANTGILTLAAANTYTGATNVNAAGLTINANGGLSSSNVTRVANATLSLATGVTAAHFIGLTTLTLTHASTSTVNLAGISVQDTMDDLIINGVVQAPGTYGVSGSGAQFVDADFTGTGVLQVVPERSTYAAMFVGTGDLAILAYHRRARHEA